jgi:hypothetical protein
MTPAALTRWLAEAEAAVAALLAPSEPGAWTPKLLAHLDDDQILELDALLRDIETEHREPTQVEQLRAMELQLAAVRQILMQDSVPPPATKPRQEWERITVKAGSKGHERPNGVGRPLPLREIRP